MAGRAELLDANMIEREQRLQIRSVRIFEHRHAAIVENEPVAIEARRQHRVGGALVAHASDQQAQVRCAARRLRAASGIWRSAKSSQSPWPLAMLVERARPHVGGAMLFGVAGIGDRQIDLAIDEAELGAAVGIARHLDQRDQARLRGRAGRRFGAAARNRARALRYAGVEFAPVDPHRAGRCGRCRQAERLVAAIRQAEQATRPLRMIWPDAGIATNATTANAVRYRMLCEINELM